MGMHPMINVATRAARSASKVLFRDFDKLEDNLLTPVRRRALAKRVTKAVRQELSEQIQSLYPKHEICFADSMPEGEVSEHRWIIDAVDAPENLQRGLPHLAMTVAYQLDGETTASLVHNPVLDETFTAVLGEGAQLGQKRIRSNKNVKALKSACVSSSAHATSSGLQETLNPIANTISNHSGGSYFSGSSSLDIVYVACGRLDAFWSLNPNPRDRSAAMLIAKEAGAMVTSLKGKRAHGQSPDLLIAHARLHEQIVSLVTAG